jgi:CDP-paratose 2-epimerase
VSPPSSAPAAPRTEPILVTGGAGFIGANLVDRLASEGHHVIVLDALLREGVEDNLAWLKKRHGSKLSLILGDIRDGDAVTEAIAHAGAVFHLAAQVAVTSSIENPVEDFEINVAGTIRLLEAVRRLRRGIPVVFASTNKVYGDLGDIALEECGDAYLPADPELRRHGIAEQRPLSFHTPYGCSKGAADQYALDYGRSYGIPAVVMRMSCIYGPRQFGTEDQGWVAHFLIRTLRNEPIVIYGDGRQVRDILYVDDAVAAYLAAWRRIGTVAGQALNLGGGPANAVSLRQVLTSIESITGVRPRVSFADWRPGDQRYYASDTRRANALLGLAAPLAWQDGLVRLARWLGSSGNQPAASGVAEWATALEAR